MILIEIPREATQERDELGFKNFQVKMSNLKS